MPLRGRTHFVVVIHWDTPLGQSLLDALGEPGGAVREFAAGRHKHPVILCTSFESAGVAGFVRLTHVREWPKPGSEQILWVPSGHIVLAIETEGDRMPPGFVRAPRAEERG